MWGFIVFVILFVVGVIIVNALKKEFGGKKPGTASIRQNSDGSFTVEVVKENGDVTYSKLNNGKLSSISSEEAAEQTRKDAEKERQQNEKRNRQQNEERNMQQQNEEYRNRQRQEEERLRNIQQENDNKLRDTKWL